MKPQIFCDTPLDIIFQIKTRAKAMQIKIRLDHKDTWQWSKTAACLPLDPQYLEFTENNLSSEAWVKRTFFYLMPLCRPKEAEFQFCSVYAYPSSSLFPFLFLFLHPFFLSPGRQLSLPDCCVHLWPQSCKTCFFSSTLQLQSKKEHSKSFGRALTL